MTEADLIWNRACMGGGSNLRAGDQALAALLLAHGHVMNGGLLHAMDCMSETELSDACTGYRFFGFDSVADLMARTRRIHEADEDTDDIELELNQKYETMIPNDSTIEARFLAHLARKPVDFSPL